MSSHRGGGGIFISYRRGYTTASAGRLYDHLSDHFGEEFVFMDVDSIAFGTDFTTAIADAVSKCDFLLVLIGEDWLAAASGETGKKRIDDPDDWIRIEIETALQREIPVVPILLDGTPLPQAGDLPPSLLPLIRRQAFELDQTSFRSDAKRLITAMDQVIQAKSRQSAKASEKPAPAPVVQNRTWDLDLVDRSFNKLIFCLSSGQESHIITFRYGLVRTETITVDGETDVSDGLSIKGEHTLDTLSAKLNCPVTVTVTRTKEVGIGVKSFVLRIGSQTLVY